MKKFIVFLLCLALLLPAAAMAEEYVIDWGPFYLAYGETAEAQYPNLTEDELARAEALRADASAHAGRSILNPLDAADLAVYTLPAEDYAGLTAYVLLPGRALTDDDLLALIEACDAAGADITALSPQNCMRGGGHTMTRNYSADETARKESLREQYLRAGLRPDQPFTPLPGDDGVGLVALNTDSFSGLPTFVFLPARRMTDDELLRILCAEFAEAEGDYAANETLIRRELHEKLGMPLSAVRLSEFIGKESDNALYGTDRLVYSAAFETVGDGCVNYYAQLDIAAGTLSYGIALNTGYAFSDVRGDASDAKWERLARERLSGFGADAIAAVRLLGEAELQFAGYGVRLEVDLADGARCSIDLAYQDDGPAMIEYNDAIRTANMDSLR